MLRSDYYLLLQFNENDTTKALAANGDTDGEASRLGFIAAKERQTPWDQLAVVENESS